MREQIKHYLPIRALELGSAYKLAGNSKDHMESGSNSWVFDTGLRAAERTQLSSVESW